MNNKLHGQVINSKFQYESAILSSQSDTSIKVKMRLKVDLCYVTAKEGMALEKYPALYELKVHHGVDLGSAYKSPQSAKSFMHYTAAAQHKTLMEALAETHFVSFLMDGSTDAGNLEQELVVVLFCLKDDAAEEIKFYTRFLSTATPENADTNSLIECLSHSQQLLGIEDVLDQASVLAVEGKPILVGGGACGASVNVAQHSGM